MMLATRSCAREKQNGRPYGPVVCRFRSSLGGGIPGGQPPGGLIGGGGGPTGGSGMVGGGDRGLSRKVLRRAFGSRVFPESCPTKGSATCNPSGSVCRYTSKTSPFRAATISGDPAGTINTEASHCLPRVNHVNGTNATLVFTRAKKQIGGGVRQKEDGGSLWTGNGRYVYDGSDYARFKRLQSQNRNYNDSSFGGSSPSNAFSALARVRGRGVLPG